jgi:hypothetical protein
MKLLLTLISGVCWTIVYIELIRRGVKDKTCGMPLFALSMNISWEILYSIDGLFITKSFITAQNIADVVWAFCDVLILSTWIRYGKETLPVKAQKYFIPYTVLALAAGLAFQLAFYLHFTEYGTVNATAASQYSAFAQNAIMSILFLNMYFQREDRRGQSLTIAVCKCLGTLAPTILGGFIESINIYIILFGAISFVFDILYIYFLHHSSSLSYQE